MKLTVYFNLFRQPTPPREKRWLAMIACHLRRSRGPQTADLKPTAANSGPAVPPTSIQPMPYDYPVINHPQPMADTPREPSTYWKVGLILTELSDESLEIMVDALQRVAHHRWSGLGTRALSWRRSPAL